MPKPGEVVSCPVLTGTGSEPCGQEWFAVTRGEREYVLLCAAGHEIRRFFVLVPPPPPPPPERGKHAAATRVTDPDR